jgi:hypothetical protein
MYTRQFGFGIKIVAAKSKRLYDDAAPMSDTEGKAFVDAIWDLLDKLTDKTFGLNLISEIEAAQKEVIIFGDDNSGQGSAAMPYPANIPNVTNRFIKLRQIPDNVLKAWQKQNPRVVPPSMQSYAASFHATLEKAHANRDVAASVLGISRSDLDDIERGVKPLPPEAYHRFAMFFYDHLESGDGCSVALRFDRGQAGPNDPEVIMLGHELIHIWRMVTGMRIFEGGWEEEAMTTGIPPFMTMKYTENRLRAEQGYTLRASYKATCMTSHYRIVREMVKGAWPEHIKAWSEWKDAHPKEAKFDKIKKISGPIQHLYNK